jgi:hypothetical protein
MRLQRFATILPSVEGFNICKPVTAADLGPYRDEVHEICKLHNPERVERKISWYLKANSVIDSLKLFLVPLGHFERQ